MSSFFPSMFEALPQPTRARAAAIPSAASLVLDVIGTPSQKRFGYLGRVFG